MTDVSSEAHKAHHYQFPVLIFHKEDKKADIRHIHYETVGVPSLTVTQAYSKIPVYYEDVEKPVSIEIPKAGYACSQYYHGKCYNALVKMILKCEEDGVRNLLEAHKDRETHILDVKCACNRPHLSDSIVTASNCFGMTALMFAIRAVGCYADHSKDLSKAETSRHICKLILQYGANPNTLSSIGVGVLDIAAVAGDKTLMEILVSNGAYVSQTLKRLGMQSDRDKVTDKQMKAHQAFTVIPIQSLLHEDIVMCSPDPILTCFYSCIVLNNIATFRVEFAERMKQLTKEMKKISFDYLDLCENGWEARTVVMQEVLTSQDTKMKLLDYAVICRQKYFCSHKYMQHIASGLWYGIDYSSTWYDALKRVFFALTVNIIFPILYFNTYIRRKEAKPFSWEYYLVRTAKIPSVCFLADLMNHLILVGLLITACQTITSEDDYLQVYILWLALFSRLLIEYDFLRIQGWRMYTTSVVNIINVVVGSSLFMSIVTTISSRYIKDIDTKSTLILITSYIHALAAMALVQRLIEMFDITKTLGPLTEAVRRMVRDVVNFIVLIGFTILSFSIPMYAVAYQSAMVSKEFHGGTGVLVDNFKSYTQTVSYLGWNLFGLGEAFGGNIPNDKLSTFVQNVLLFLYLVSAGLLLMNLLIAILNNTYAGVVENAQIEWMFCRVKRVVKYSGVQPFIFPFILYIYPFYKMSRYSRKYRKDKDCNIRRNICNTLVREDIKQEEAVQSAYLHRKLKERYFAMKRGQKR